MGTNQHPLLPDGPNGNGKRPEPAIAPILLTARQAAAICGKSLRTWRTWDAGGRIPRPVRIGRSTLWRASELEAWVDAGCPARSEWESRQ